MEQKLNKLAESPSDQWMRKCACKFLERVSLDEYYIDIALECEGKRDQIDLYGMWKEVWNKKMGRI